MKNLVVNYDLLNEKIDKKIILLADYHDFSKEKSMLLADDVLKEEADLIILAGDIMQGPKYRSKKDLADLRELLSKLSEGCPVVLEKGNHDLVGYDEESRKGYLSLSSARRGMVYPLDNDAVTIDGVRVIGVCPTRKAFAPSIQESGRALLQFKDDWTSSSIEREIDPDLYNLLICHNPKIFAQARIVEEQKKLQITSEQRDELRRLSKTLGKIDLVTSGHLHNGYIPLEKTLQDPEKYMDIGIWEMPMEKNIRDRITMLRPWVLKKTDMCRGVIYVGEDEGRIIELANGKYYFKYTKDSDPILLTSPNLEGLTPIAISGGVNKYFNLPVDAAEITSLNLKKKLK